MTQMKPELTSVLASGCVAKGCLQWWYTTNAESWTFGYFCVSLAKHACYSYHFKTITAITRTCLAPLLSFNHWSSFTFYFPIKLNLNSNRLIWSDVISLCLTIFFSICLQLDFSSLTYFTQIVLLLRIVISKNAQCLPQVHYIYIWLCYSYCKTLGLIFRWKLEILITHWITGMNCFGETKCRFTVLLQHIWKHVLVYIYKNIRLNKLCD